MDSLRSYVEGPYVPVAIDLDDEGWHARAEIPAAPGWYFIETSAPLEVLARQALWQRRYTQKRSGKVVSVKNYDLAARCAQYDPVLAGYLNTRFVYSGRASNLQARAREHTSADPGTGGLALSRYPELADYQWSFNYRTLAQFMPDCPNPAVLLLLGEQVWRAKYGWPVLCAR
jgi:hypothetical protein